MTAWLHDLRYGVRMLRKNAGFTVVVVLTLALGIGANTAVFSVFDRVILQLLPVENPRELVLIQIDGPEAPGVATSDNHQTVHSHPRYRDFRDRTDVFSGVAARASTPMVFAQGIQADRVSGELVSGNFFEVLGIRALRGRLFTDEDDRQEGAHPVAVISHAFWSRRFGGREDIIGQPIAANGVPMTIIGVVPPQFTGVMTGRTPDVYVTLAMRKQIRPALYATDRLPERMIRSLSVLARLKPGIAVGQASAVMQGIWRRIQEQELEELGTRIGDREEFLGCSLRLVPALQGIHALRRAVEKPLLSVMALALLVLLITCVNITGLLVTRAVARRREFALRMALGAARCSLGREVLLECLILGLLGGAAGLAVAFGTTRVLTALVEIGDITPRTFLFSMILASLSALSFGLVPAWQASRPQGALALKDQTPGAGLARSQTRFRRGAVVIQITLSMLLLVAAGLFTKTLYNLRRFDPGFRTESLLCFTLDPALSGYNGERRRLLYERVLGELRRLPGVRTVGAAALPVLGHSDMTSSLTVEGYQAGDREEVTASRNVVSAGYFDAMGIPFVLGRAFQEQDRAGGPRVAVVNEAFVQRYCRGQNPLGRKISFDNRADSLDIEIVGVVKNQKNASLREKTKHFVYTPYTQEDDVPSLSFYVWCRRDEAALGPDVRRVVRELDAHLPVSQMQTVRARREEMLRPERTVALLACGFAAIAAVLAAVGLYGLLAYGVLRRTREIGIRMALGAPRAQVFRLIFQEALTCLGVGLVLGVPLALSLGRYLESQLFGLQAGDLTVVSGAAAILGLTVSVAAFVPARRAARINPMAALRWE